MDEKDVLTSEKEKAVGIPVPRFDIANFTVTGTDSGNVEENYKQMIEEDPSNPLILRSYAQFLYQVIEELGCLILLRPSSISDSQYYLRGSWDQWKRIIDFNLLVMNTTI